MISVHSTISVWPFCVTARNKTIIPNASNCKSTVPATITAITVHIRFAQRFLITSYIAYERLIRMHFGELGDMPIGRVKNLMVQDHITKLSRLVDENGLSENYLTRLRTFMHMVFEYAVQNNLITHNPANGVRIPKTGIFENRAITKEEADRLIQAVKKNEITQYKCTYKMHTINESCAKMLEI